MGTGSQSVDLLILAAALGSWADEMESAPLPSMPTSSYGARDRGDRGGDRAPPGEGRAFTTSSWERSGSGMGGGGSFGGDRGGGGGMGSDFGGSQEWKNFNGEERSG